VMKKIVIFLLAAPTILIFLFLLSLAVARQQGLLSKSDLDFLVELGKRDGPGAVVATIRTHVFGVDPAHVPNSAYARDPVDGRGHTPWVLRGNLDGRPRMLELALAPQTWAAYDTERQSLYQIWEGEVLFEGAAYDYRHGPQPISQGAWYWHDEKGAKWFIEADGQEIPATIQYLGHEYGEGRKTVSMRFALLAQNYRLEITEQPDLITRDGERYFTRSFQREDSLKGITAGFRTGNGEYFLASGVVEIPLNTSTNILPLGTDNTDREKPKNKTEQGRTVIDDSDCLACHAQDHTVTGPAWSQIAGKFRGKAHDKVIASLAGNILNGSVGTWGLVPMPPHPRLSRKQAEAAVTYILGVDVQETDLNGPLDESGHAYVATRRYSVLPRLESLHPSFHLENIAPPGFEPMVGGMAVRNDGKLVVASWDKDGAVFLVDPDAPLEERVQRIAEGLHEPLGLTIVGNRIFVLQKQELTELIDTNGDEVIDRYKTVSNKWPSSSNFHSFAFGLLHQDDAFHFLLSICVLPGGSSCPEQLPTQGKLLRVDMAGNLDVFASGFRTPNGIVAGPDGNIFVTDNQGDWLPASKVIRVKENGFYGSRAVPDPGVIGRKEDPPVVWLPQDEVGNSPTQPLTLIEGPYAGQMIHGDIFNGGLKRVFLETINGVSQGAVFHFSAGFQGAINRLARGPEGAIYVGVIGSPPNWGEYGKPWHGLERMTWVGNEAFEMQSVQAQADGLLIALTQPLSAEQQLAPSDILVKQWFYHPNEQYGGPKYDETELRVTSVELLNDSRSLRLQIPGLKSGHVVYLRLDDRLRSASGHSLWTAESWYTMNAIPEGEPELAKSQSTGEGWRELFDGHTMDGWRNYGGDENNVRKWTVQEGTLALVQEGIFPMWDMIKSAAFGGPGGDLVYYREKFQDFELSLQWKISPGGNSGIFYLVKDETENVSWRTGIEMQILDNDEHSDGKIHTHRAGDLYDLIAADPETVKPPGEWNDVLIRIKDNVIEHWLNGVKVVSVVRGSEEWNALVEASKFSDMPGYGKSESGFIALQDHGDPVWFRNIRVRDL
jgi:cytochrome c551/c552